MGQALDRGMDDTQHRPVIVDQGDIDGELTVAFYEFPGAVQGIDQPELPPGLAVFLGFHRRFLRQHGNVPVEAGQFTAYNLMGGSVGGRQRRPIGLGINVETAFVDVEYLLPRPMRDP